MDELDIKYYEENDKNNQKKVKEFKDIVPSNVRITKPREFKSKPLRRTENDFLMYKEIFVQPKEVILSGLKEKEKDFEDLFHTGTQRQYDKILNIYNEENDKSNVKKIPKFETEGAELQNRTKSKFLSTATLMHDIQLKLGQTIRELSPQKELEKAIHENFAILE